LLKKIDTPESWSLEGTDFINKCISRRPESRLGLNNAAELKTHVWLKEFDWKNLARHEFKSPFKPILNPILPDKVLNSQISYKDTRIHLQKVQDEELLQNAEF
jgi:serine/threonine protein kinase